MPPEETAEQKAEPAPRPQPEFTFLKLIVRKAIFEQVGARQTQAGEKKPVALASQIQFSLRIQINREDLKSGEVTLATIVLPDMKWQPYRIEVTVSGIFGIRNADAETFEQFCKIAAPSILFPYVRQIVHSLTTEAEYGLVRLNPINIQQLIASNWTRNEDADDATDASEPSQQL